MASLSFVADSTQKITRHSDGNQPVISDDKTLIQNYTEVRGRTLAICSSLEIEDYLVQPMEDASPPKWHIAHVTWFFETFLLKPHVPGYKPFNTAYEVLFNSYYNGVGEQFPRPNRGHLSRPTVKEIKSYRQYVDEAMGLLLQRELSDDLVFKITLGLHHEQQHQELLLTDIKYNLGHNPLKPAYISIEASIDKGSVQHESSLGFVAFKGGIYEIGAQAPTHSVFVFDNESPRHEVLVRDFEIADRLTSNREYLQFIHDDGYTRPELWLSDAWALNKQGNKPGSPLYWQLIDSEWLEYTLGGLRPLQLDQPLCHVSGYEADAFARWRDCRLPTEQEWEIMATDVPLQGNFADSGLFHPTCFKTIASGRLPGQVFGDVWEWTSSSYGPYPGFKHFPGKLGEYNGKFMANQLVLRGGSCVTPANHIRRSYRNFFYPKDQWQFSGIRLVNNQ